MGVIHVTDLDRSGARAWLRVGGTRLSAGSCDGTATTGFRAICVVCSMMKDSRKRAAHYRTIAALMRQRAQSHLDTKAREQAMSLAIDYEQLADAIEQQETAAVSS